MSQADARTPSRIARVIAIAGGGATLVAMLALASVGGDHSPVAAALTLLDLTIRGGGPAAAYLVAAIGLGRLARPLIRNASDPAALQAALGISIMLALSHALGTLGLLAGDAGRIVAGGVVVVGLILLAHQLARRGRSIQLTLPWTSLLALPALALLVVAACNPPGWLWSSEFGGFDALSYHLQLPQEWAQLGRVQPLDHNVYSYLPGLVESAFYHLAVLIGPAPGPGGIVAGSGAIVASCQFLHAGLALATAALIARAVLHIARGSARSDAAGLAAAFAISIPWVIVAGSLAYNDLGVTAMLAPAILVAADDRLSPALRGGLAGWLIGIACGCKPTAILLAAPVAGLVLLGTIPPRRWPIAIVAGSLAGLAAMAPWLARNAVHAGNPVFPFAASLLGQGHWSAEQVARYSEGHRFGGSALERALMLVRAAPDGQRGLLHHQWSIFLPIVLAAGGAAILTAPRRIPVLLALGIASQAVAWMVATHLQSRFLLPMVVPGALLVGIAAAAVVERARRRRPVVRALIALIVLVPAVASMRVFLAERDGRPNELLVSGVGVLTGDAYRDEFARAAPADRETFLARTRPEILVNLVLPPDARVYLLGDSTPLYFRRDVIYHTTWDTSPLGELMRLHPDDPGAWTAGVRRMGAQFVLVNFAELARLRGDGWYDPLVDPDAVADWLETWGDPIATWPASGQALIRLRAALRLPEGDPSGG